jgi:hypothetical protein
MKKRQASDETESLAISKTHKSDVHLPSARTRWTYAITDSRLLVTENSWGAGAH